MNIAIVTGASSGMGREFVRQLGGYVSVDEIWAVRRRASALETLKAEASVPVRPIVLDLLEESSFTELEARWNPKSPMSGCLSTPRASANSALTRRSPQRTTAA